MKRKSLLLVLVLALCLALSGFVACTPVSSGEGNGGGNKPADITAINTILTETKNNTDLYAEGVIYGLTNEGYYIYDGTGSIFVIDADTDAKLGDKVTVDGNFRLKDSQPIIEKYEVTVVSGGNTTLDTTDATIATIAALSSTDRESYAKYYNIEAIIGQDASGRYTLTDTVSTLYVNKASNDEVLADYINRKINIKVITHSYLAEGWVVSVNSSADEITDVAVDIENVKEEIFAQVGNELKTVVYTGLTLPTASKLHPSVNFEWTVKTGTAITVSDNVATVKLVEVDEEVVLTLKISSYEQYASQDYTVTVKYVEAVDLADVPAIEDEAKVILTQGQIVAIYDDNIMLYKDNTYVKAVCPAEDQTEYKVGDQVTVFGSYTTSAYGFKGIDAQLVTVNSHEDVDFSTLPIVELVDDEDYLDLVKGYEDQQTYFVKFVDPYVNLSGNTSYSWIRFSGDASRSRGYTYEDIYRIFSLALSSLDDAQGFIADLNVPTLAIGAQQRIGYTFYGFLMSAGSETWQFVLAEENGMVIDKVAITEAEILASFPSTDVDALQAGNLALISSGKFASEITWTVDVDGVIDTATGDYVALQYNTKVALTASYVIDGTTYTTVVDFNFLAGGIEYKTVSQVIAAGSGTYNLEAYVAAIATTSENSPTDFYTGLILTDGVNTLYYKESGDFDPTIYNVGDKLQILGVTAEITAGHIQNAQGGEFTVVSTGNTIDYTNINAIEIASEAELIAYAESSTPNQGLIIKFTGHFGFIGTGSGVPACRMQLTYKEGLTGSAGARYAFADYTAADKGNRTFAINLAGTVNMMGANWWTSFGIPENGGSGKVNFATGTFYAVVGYYGNTMQSITIINSGAFNVVADKAHQADYEIRNAVSSELVAGGILPVSTVTATSIAWECSVGSIAINADGTYTAVADDTPATLTAIYEIDGVSCTTYVEVTFKGNMPTITLAQALQTRGEAVKFTAQVIAVSVNGEKGTVADAPNGFILSDGVNTIFYKTEVIGEFKRGDNVIVNGATIEAASNMATGGSMSLVSEGTVAIDYTTLVHDTVTSNEELAAYAANHGLVSGSVLKITGTFYISGTSSSDADNWRGRLAMHTTTGETGAIYQWGSDAFVSAISLHGHGNEINFANWVEDFGFKFPSSGKAYEIVGTVTLVYSETTSNKYSSWTIIDYDITTPATY